MLACSDSEDDTKLDKFLEAADTTLLCDDMFKQFNKTESTQEKPIAESLNVLPKSKRHLLEDEHVNGDDINLPESVRLHIFNKLGNLIEQQIEFCENIQSLPTLKDRKGKVKLLLDSDCYVKAYEDCEFESKDMRRKPIIKRRRVEKDQLNEDERLKSVAVAVDDIIAETNKWAEKPPRANTFFQYKADSKGAHNLVMAENEFTQLRRKNKWKETKIKKHK